MTDVLIPTLAASAVVIVLKLLETFMGRPARREDEAARVRGELRGDLGTLRQEFARLRESEAAWRERYFAHLSEMEELRARVRDCDENLAEFRSANYVLTERVAELERRLR